MCNHKYTCKDDENDVKKIIGRDNNMKIVIELR